MYRAFVVFTFALGWAALPGCRPTEDQVVYPATSMPAPEDAPTDDTPAPQAGGAQPRPAADATCTEGLARIESISAGRALFVERLSLPERGELAVAGSSGGRERGVILTLRAGQTLRLRDLSGECPGLQILGPDAELAYTGGLTETPIDIRITQDGEWEFDFLGYLGAHGRNAFDARMSLVTLTEPVPAEFFKGWAGHPPYELFLSPEGRRAFADALGPKFDPFLERADVQPLMEELEGRWLVGHGCIPHSCPSGGGWFVVDLRTGAITAAEYGEGPERAVAGDILAIAPAVRRYLDEALR